MTASGGHFLVLGAGGLGCPCIAGLVTAGADHVTVVDHDRVEAHNLQRQVLYLDCEVGCRKVDAIQAWSHRVGGRTALEPIHAEIDEDLLRRELDRLPADAVVLECTDDPALKFLVNDLAVARRQRFVIGAALRFAGQVMAWAPGHACYRCIFEGPPTGPEQASCAAAGVLGPLCGVIGALMATAALRLAGAHPETVAGQLLAFDALTSAERILQPRPRPGCRGCGALAHPTGRSSQHLPPFEPRAETPFSSPTFFR